MKPVAIKINDKPLEFVSGGKRVDALEPGKFEWLGVGFGPDGNVGQAFETRAAFIKWSKGGKSEAKVSQIFQTIDDVRRYEKSDNARAIERQKRIATRVQGELEELSKTAKLAIGSEELLLRASTKSPILEGRIFDSALLFRDSGLHGPLLPLITGLPMPDFSWFGFDNMLTSGIVHGMIILCTNSWYSGSGIAFQTFPFWDTATFDFSGSGWNDAISSGFSLL